MKDVRKKGKSGKNVGDEDSLVHSRYQKGEGIGLANSQKVLLCDGQYRYNSEENLPENVELVTPDFYAEGVVKNPICRRFFMLFRTLGTIITACSLVADYAYATKQTFSGIELYLAYVCMLFFRLIYAMILIVKNKFSVIVTSANFSFTLLPFTYKIDKF